MPQAPHKCNPALAIVLEAPECGDAFTPGDILRGWVVREAHITSPRAYVTIKLCGRSKTTVRPRGGSKQGTGRSRFQLIDETKSSQTLYDGPINILPGQEPVYWPFSIQIPTHVPPEIAQTGLWSCLPLDPDSVTHQRLPSTIVSYDEHVYAFVEYWLEAGLHVEGQGNTTGTFDSTLPFTLRNYRPSQPVVDFKHKAYLRNHGVASRSLIPNMENSKPSMKAKLKRIFQSSSVPTFRFGLEIVIPSIIQLDPPNGSDNRKTLPIAIMLRVIPNWEFTSEYIRGIVQEARLTHLGLSIECTTQACGDRNQVEESKYEVPITNTPMLQNPLHIPCLADLPPINVGEAMNLRCGYHGPIIDPMPATHHVFPTMVTYNFLHRHRLKWELKLDVAGQNVRAVGDVPVLVVDSIDPRGRQEGQAEATTGNLFTAGSWTSPTSEALTPMALMMGKAVISLVYFAIGL